MAGLHCLQEPRKGFHYSRFSFSVALGLPGAAATMPQSTRKFSRGREACALDSQPGRSRHSLAVLRLRSQYFQLLPCRSNSVPRLRRQPPFESSAPEASAAGPLTFEVVRSAPSVERSAREVFVDRQNWDWMSRTMALERRRPRRHLFGRPILATPGWPRRRRSK